jgi:hypothetical protein
VLEENVAIAFEKLVQDYGPVPTKFPFDRIAAVVT